ncbi:fasciclin domain-containing protein [Falsiroseomonas oryziterrae]|uniref:fasciclin domain-containing protein n=1 Tax=Falsiroseomonas oryziterrae TaxID=2911368 RepID=UPI001F44A115|nr:fasciclin domain-containing protein [Roseomonas sp. NPKOSM-4]
MTSMNRRGLLALGTLAAGTLAIPGARAQSLRTIADTLAGDNRFARFLDLVTRATAVETFREPGPITVFAPVDEAFTGAPAGLLQDLLSQSYGRGSDTAGDASNRQRWLALINYHVVPGAFDVAQLGGADRRLRTLNGGDIQISSTGGTMRVTNPAPAQQLSAVGSLGANVSAAPAQLVGSPISASNGVIYPINQILFP